jgi:predicted DNA-binding antitoxin AbrB/MazE fold protein
MQTQIDAIYEDGVFKPLAKLDLPEHARVQLILKGNGEPDARPLPDWPRSIPADLYLADPTIDRTEVQAALARIPGSIVDELRRQREGRL